MNGPTRRLATSLFLGFLVLLGSVTWIQVIGVDRYRDDPRNARTSISESGKERGIIVAVDGTVLARSEPDPEDAQSFLRVYPAGPAFAPIVGYTSRLAGSAGLERGFAEELRSRRDLTPSDLLAALFGRDLRPRSLQVTILPELQQAAYDALGGARGAVVAIDPATGDLLAYVTSPSFDPQTLTGDDAVAVREELLADPDEPTRDRAGNELVRPGSTFKTIVTAAAFETGTYTPETTFADTAAFQLPGSEASIANADGNPCGNGREVTVQTAFVRSCNTVFAALAIEIGAPQIGRIAERFGFGESIELPWSTTASLFPTEELEQDPAALGQSGIGERDVRATPLQMAMVAATIANGGETMTPRVVSQIFDADGETVESFEPRSLGNPISQPVADTMSELMERVVTEGTGRRAAVPGVRVAGKTGTAEGVEGAPDVWFIGFAPVENPRIAIAVMVEDGGDAGGSATGGGVAAPIAATVIDRWLSIRP
ncbi:MAG: penicillin-binding transpeptidase domain-containing protein [Acidimicrobiia bacterium]|nr:penicillin-binding transpeptidase domain-containing protein [Acidimicrobiia bacterium]MDH4308650.1 penicillin-binding transpeptidase domain-containing protein [Acidimicrobiia bacterium]MDH5293014.1 penicillin-binding transpeptidase domain-containing protein [Acidimicrobiia bacterium]